MNNKTDDILEEWFSSSPDWVYRAFCIYPICHHMMYRCAALRLTKEEMLLELCRELLVENQKHLDAEFAKLLAGTCDAKKVEAQSK